MNMQIKRQALKRICRLGRIAGWGVIVLGIFEVVAYAYAHLIAHVAEQPTLYRSITSANNILAGLLVLTTAQFVRYVVEEDAEPKWLLRHGHMVMVVFALYLFVTGSLYGWVPFRAMCELLWTHSPDQMIPLGRELGLTFGVFVFLLPPAAKALCVLGAAAMLRTVLPILAESKTLA
ncbi:MAG: hypothetical protein WC655_10685 [Candidatus Hydrogenedentales bacterium]|jgi:hypothetical protein